MMQSWRPLNEYMSDRQLGIAIALARAAEKCREGRHLWDADGKCVVCGLRRGPAEGLNCQKPALAEAVPQALDMIDVAQAIAAQHKGGEAAVAPAFSWQGAKLGEKVRVPALDPWTFGPSHSLPLMRRRGP